MADVPDSPEAVALELMRLILNSERPIEHNRLDSARLLDLYAECLAAVGGRRDADRALH